MCALNSQNKSLQWMINVGVDAADVEWLQMMSGSKELHAPEAASRVERIYTAAMNGALSSGRPEVHLRQALH